MFRDGAARLDQRRQRVVEAARADMAGRVAARGIVAHARRAEDLRNPKFVAEPIRFGLPLALRSVQEIRADRVVQNREADLRAGVADL
jgi:hypothetical protein